MSQMMVDYKISSLKENMDESFIELKEIINNSYKVGPEGKVFSKTEFDKIFLLLSNLQRLSAEYGVVLEDKEGSSSFEKVSSNIQEQENQEGSIDDIHANSDEQFCKDIEDLQKQSDYEIKEFGCIRPIDMSVPENISNVQVDMANIPEGMSPTDFGFVKLKDSENTPS